MQTVVYDAFSSGKVLLMCAMFVKMKPYRNAASVLFRPNLSASALRNFVVNDIKIKQRFHDAFVEVGKVLADEEDEPGCKTAVIMDELVLKGGFFPLPGIKYIDSPFKLPNSFYS